MLDFGFYNIDCMQGMKEFPDNYFDLAIVDPPYGDGGGTWTNGTRFGQRFDRYTNPRMQQPRPMGDTAAVGGGGLSRTGGTWATKFGKKLLRGTLHRGKNTSTNFSAFHAVKSYGGGNYFPLPATRCFIIWRKTNVPEKFSMAMAEYAWTSFNANAKVFDYSAVGQDGRFHPTQKPVALYKWLLSNYAKPGDKILDTHVGSASSLIACYDMGFDYVGFEIDEEYYNKASKRLEEEMAQTRWRF